MRAGLEVALEAGALLYSFAGLAIVCDDFLVPSLEVLCLRWGVREDVAGASFMAFGSAAPEIIVNAISTLKATTVSPESVDLGLGAILGSSVIAFSLIPGSCVLFGGRDVVCLELKRRPLVRDVGTYLVALLVLFVSFMDGVLALAETVSLLCIYVVYGLVVFFAPKLRQRYHSHVLCRPLQPQESFVIRQEALLAESRGPGVEGGIDEGDEACSSADEAEAGEVGQDQGQGQDQAQEGELAATGPTQHILRALAALTWPLRKLVGLTCPDCSRGSGRERLYPLTFMLSFLWVAALSLVISTVVERWGNLSHVPLSFFGFFLVALGAEVPDTVQSVTVARRGYGSMAVSNAIGSQICNICFGLGLPWTLATLSGHTIRVSDASNLKLAAGLQLCNMGGLALLLFAPVVCCKQPKARLTRRKGVALVFAYVAVVVAYASATL